MSITQIRGLFFLAAMYDGLLGVVALLLRHWSTGGSASSRPTTPGTSSFPRCCCWSSRRCSSASPGTRRAALP